MNYASIDAEADHLISKGYLPHEALRIMRTVFPNVPDHVLSARILLADQDILNHLK